jgi:hypothetical protein
MPLAGSVLGKGALAYRSIASIKCGGVRVPTNGSLPVARPPRLCWRCSRMCLRCLCAFSCLFMRRLCIFSSIQSTDAKAAIRKISRALPSFCLDNQMSVLCFSFMRCLCQVCSGSWRRSLPHQHAQSERRRHSGAPAEAHQGRRVGHQRARYPAISFALARSARQGIE